MQDLRKISKKAEYFIQKVLSQSVHDKETSWKEKTMLSVSEPFVLTREGIPKIFSVVRDDRYPHRETGIGLWLIANGTVDAGDAEHPDRLFIVNPENICTHKIWYFPTRWRGFLTSPHCKV